MNIEIVEDSNTVSIEEETTNVLIASSVSFGGLKNLNDVDSTLTPISNSILKYNLTNTQWEIGSDVAPVTSVNGEVGIIVLDTDDLLEGTNKFYASSLFNTDFSGKTTSNLIEDTNLYYTEARVTANTNVNANTTARHNAVTVTDSTEIDFTLTNQALTAEIKPASIDETKLDVSVNASLDLADSSVQTETDPIFIASQAVNIDANDITNLGNLSNTNTGDQIISDATITTTDITTNNVSSAKHGFAPKGDGTTTKYLNANGLYSIPAAGGDVSTSGTPVDNDFAKFVNGTDIEGRSYSEVRTDLDLEAGTDFYSKTAEDTWRSSVTQTEMSYLNGTTSDIQTQLNAKGDMDDLIDDTTPELGGELDSGAHSIGFTLQTATGDGTTTIDWKIGNKFKFTFGAQNDIFTFTAPSNPCSLTLILVQDGTGSRTVTWPGTVKWPNSTAPTLTTTASAIDIISLLYDGTNYYGSSALAFG